MRHLLALIPALCLTFTAFMGAAILIGQQQPLPEHLAVLHLTDCAPPCWIGIVPGQTRLSRAIPRVKEVYSNLSHYRLSFSESPNSFSMQLNNRDAPNDITTIIIHTYEDRIISTIGFDTSGTANGPNIAELYGLLGAPTGFTLESITPSSTAYDVAFSDHDCISANTVTYLDNGTILLQHPAGFYFGALGRCEAQDRRPPWQPWRGFRSVAAYAR